MNELLREVVDSAVEWAGEGKLGYPSKEIQDKIIESARSTVDRKIKYVVVEIGKQIAKLKRLSSFLRMKILLFLMILISQQLIRKRVNSQVATHLLIMQA